MLRELHKSRVQAHRGQVRAAATGAPRDEAKVGRVLAFFYLFSTSPPPPPPPPPPLPPPLPPPPLLTRHQGDRHPGRLSATSKSPSLTVSLPTRISTCRDTVRAGGLCTPASAAAFARADRCVTWHVHVAHVPRSFMSAVGRVTGRGGYRADGGSERTGAAVNADTKVDAATHRTTRSTFPA
ncbi:hypothetical protein K523DRAFT_358585 [Schizophyllum commune Tattone D]|nr:hypothetical protein K523DRAFT_358585 [Schizophyllum commune Tattone D]